MNNKPDAHKVAKVLRIARRIEHMTGKDRRRAARWFAFWVKVINKQPVFQQKEKV